MRRDEASNGHARYEAAHLQYVLRRLWDEEARGGSSLLRLATLEQLGGSEAIFERHFDEAVAGLSAGEQDALGQAFRFLVTSAGTKRAETATDLAELAGVPQPTLERALEHLRAARILTPVAAGGHTRYELAHDLLAEPALEWRRARERAREMRALRRTIAGLGLVAALLTGLIVWALLERGAAGRQADRAQAQALVARSANQLSVDPEHSVALARQAWQLSNTPEAEDALRRALTASLVRQRREIGTTWRGVVANDVAVNDGPDGVHVWRGFDAGLPAKSLDGGGAVLSADGTRVAATSSDGVQAAPTDGGAVIRVAGGSAPALSADGRYLAVVARDGTMRVLDAQTGQALARHRGLPNPVLAFAGDGRLVAGDCLGGGGMVVWNWRTGGTRTLPAPSSAETTIPRGGAPTCLLAPSPDGTRVAQSLLGGSAALWDLGAGRLIASNLARDRPFAMSRGARTATCSQSRQARSRRCSTAPAAPCRAPRARWTSSRLSRSTHAEAT